MTEVVLVALGQQAGGNARAGVGGELRVLLGEGRPQGGTDAFDDFAGGETDPAALRRILGIG